MDIAGRPPDATAASTACLSKRASSGTPDAVGFAADLTDPACVSDLIEQVGDVEVLVNNAGMASLGVLDATGPLEDMATATWAATIERNLTTAFYVTRACLRGMKAREQGPFGSRLVR